jgi:hypothetical protein
LHGPYNLLLCQTCPGEICRHVFERRVSNIIHLYTVYTCIK